MMAIRDLVNRTLDSPTYGRDRANLISGLTIGTAGLLLNAAVMMLFLPLLVDPDDPDFRWLTENIELGQLLALILLGGAAAFATLLIPLRLVSVFWGPRIGRYFDQIVLSGISPVRFVIGKVMSQNLFLALILFLLVPYLVLSLALGGVAWDVFLAGLFLVWLYCLALAVVTLWVSLYLNELLAAGVVIAAATTFGVLGCIPLRIQPFVMTPLPALLHPVYSSIPTMIGRVPDSFFLVFSSCAACLTAVIGASLFGIALGPLYGIIRENSTFGEVVRAGDSKRKRWFRLRLHIQRPSELAFFYENRSRAFTRHEGLIRWGTGLIGLLVLAGIAYGVFLYLMTIVLPGFSGRSMRWPVYEFHATVLTIHGCSLALAIFAFSHAKNSTYLRLPVCCGRSAEVARLDTAFFVLFLLIVTTASVAIPLGFEQYFVVPLGQTLFPYRMYGTEGRPVNYLRIALEGTAVLSFAGLTVYAEQRLACLMTWMKSTAFLQVANIYFFVVCLTPIMVASLIFEVPEFRRIPIVAEWAPIVAMSSPITVILFLFNEMGSRFPRDVSTAPFYIVHGVLLGIALFEIRRRGRKLRDLYLAGPSGESA